MEAVLSGVSAGVIGLDSQDRITLVSRSAEKLLGLGEGDLVGKQLAEAVPVFARHARRAATTTAQGRARRTRSRSTSAARSARFAVRVTRERAGGGDVGSVLTFDDVTELVVGPAHRRPGPTSPAASRTRSRTR